MNFLSKFSLLIVLFFLSITVVLSQDESLSVLSEAANQGDAEAQAKLGFMYEHGQSVDKDLLIAFKWYKLAAEQGVAWAQTNLGLAYINGRGVQKNDAEAAKWFRRSALQGNIKSQEILGVLYDEGKGVPENYNEAIEWINPSNLMYIKGLEKDYANRLHFESPEIEAFIHSIVINCKTDQGKGRFMPLIGLLYARLASLDQDHMWIETFVQGRGDSFILLDALESPDGRVNTTVTFEVTSLGEVYPKGSLKVEAVLNACFGSHGPIWLIE